MAFVLHDVFRFPFDDIAAIVGPRPTACRQLAASARRRIRGSQGAETPSTQRAAIVQDFKQAWHAQDLEARRPARP